MRHSWIALGIGMLVGCSALIDLSELNGDTDSNAGAGGSIGGNDDGGRGGTQPEAGRGAAANAGEAGSGGAGEGPGPADPCEPNPCENEGVCSAEIGGFTCACKPNYAGDRCEERLLRSCLDWRRMGFELGEDHPSDVYEIDPDGPGGEDAFEVYCDMDTDGGGWTLVASRSVMSGYTGTWGTTSLDKEAPAPDDDYVLDFISSGLPEPGELMIRLEETGSTIRQTFAYDPFAAPAARTWSEQPNGTGLRRRVVAEPLYFTLSNGLGSLPMGATEPPPDFFCVTNGTHLDGFSCDGNMGQADGVGLFTSNAADELPGCMPGQAIWKGTTGALQPLTCAPPGQVTIWFRDPAASCKELKDLGVAASGIYVLDPDGSGDEDEPFNAICEMRNEIEGGGWTLVAINGLSGRPAQWRENRYPRPGASFYSGVFAASSDLQSVNAGALVTGANPIANYSVNAKTLYQHSGREFLAFVGGPAPKYIHGTLPEGCNYFDGSTTCAENRDDVDPFVVYRSDETILTDRAQACTTANHGPGFEGDNFDEFGLHLIDGAETQADLHCHQSRSTVGFQRIGRIYTTFNGNQPSTVSFWGTGVHSYWEPMGMSGVPGYVMIR